MARIPDTEIQRLKEEVAVQRLIESSGVVLKKGGRDFTGICPFHADATASLVVTPHKNLWHCFGCQIGGGPIDWVMKTRGVSFRHAVELLKEEIARGGHSSLAADPAVGVAAPVKRATVRSLPAPVTLDADDQALLLQTIAYYHQRLKQSPEALAYLASRGLDHPGLVDAFQLGVADRTLGLTLPEKNRKDGAAIRTRLQGHRQVNSTSLLQSRPMTIEQPISYKRHRYPPDIISYCVWLYFRFTLSFRDVEVLMAQRGVEVSYESIRAWCEKFGRQYAKKIRHQRGPMGDTWHLDEVYLRIGGDWKYLWRAVDQEGQVLDILVQARRNKAAAARFLKKVLRGTAQAPRKVVTDKLAAYIQPCADTLPGSTHTRDKGVNNRAENSHQLTRQRERRMKRFKSAAHAQRFLSIFSEVGNLFALARHTVSAKNHRLLLNKSLETWSDLAQEGGTQ